MSKQTTTKRRLLIYDGNAIIHRCFHALPPLSTSEGVLVNAVYGFLTMLFKSIKDLKPTHLAVTFDLPGPTFRHEQSAEYKATRIKQAPELYAQIPITKEILTAMGIQIFEMPGFEADDVIGTIATLARKEPGVETIIVTGDMDALQLVNDSTSVYTMRKGLSDTVIYDEAAVRERFGFEPKSLIDYKALRGDVSDNISGIRGIGEKTGMELIKKFGTIENLYEALEGGITAIGATERIKKILLEKKADAVQSKFLATIVCDVPIVFDFSKTVYKKVDRDVIFPWFQKLGFLSLLQRIPAESVAKVEEVAPVAEEVAVVETKKKPTLIVARDVIKTRALVEKMLKQQEVAAHLMKPLQQDLFGAAPAVIGFAWDGHTAVCEVHEEEQWDEIGRLFLDKQVALIAHDVKQFMHELALHGIRVGGEIFDVMVAAYLLQSGTRAHDLPNLVITILGEDVPVAEWTYGDPTRAARGAERVWLLAAKLRGEIADKGFKKLFDEIEMPLVAPLARMERYGIEVDAKYLAKLDKKLSGELEKISNKIYKLAGKEFNIASPQQVSEVLFETLELSAAGIKRGKSGGVSTAAGELEKLAGKHEIIDSILEHREISKLLSTYVQALPKLIAADGRVHTTFNQAVVATGRLSSSNPNLQNIPVRSELGRDIREAFVAADGYELLSCDYSQFELRIAAHLADDKKLIEIFDAGLDVHTATAAEIHGVALEAVTKEMRQSAKEVNFGVMYGMGAWGLAERTGLSREEARAFIDKYMQTFSGVANYLEETKVIARKLGYAETMFGRRRYLPELASGVHQVRASGERMAVNMPIQGTQADILKLAMIEIDKLLVRDYGFGFAITAEEREAPVRMLLQVHDELIFEVKSGLMKEIEPKILDIMSTVVKLKVPVKVDSATGKSWAEL
jgi:DNA polymerase-1